MFTSEQLIRVGVSPKEADDMAFLASIKPSERSEEQQQRLLDLTTKNSSKIQRLIGMK